MSTLREPLRFERRFLEKVWGGRALERLGIELPEGPIGETWEVVDREDERSVVAEGPHAGRTLGELVREHPRDLLGKAPATPERRFPLLVKHIDAAQHLSVQVHPDDDAAARLGGGAEGKTEAWYVLDVADGGALYAGLRPEVDEATFRAALGGGGDGVVELLDRWEVRPGDCLLVPGGTLHAIGAGVTLLEVQQNSDTVYRVYDWGRVGLDGRPRETHVDQALHCLRFGAPRRPPVGAAWEDAGEGLRRAPLARSRWFGMNALEVSVPTRLSTAGQYQLYAVVGGAGTLSVRADGVDEVRLRRGDVWLVPAAAGYHDVAPDAGGLRLVQALWRP